MNSTSLLVDLSGEHPTLPFIEASRLFSSADPSCVLTRQQPRQLVIETHLGPDQAASLCRRLVLSKEALIILERCDDPLSLYPEEGLLSILDRRTFSVRSRRFGRGAPSIEREVGAIILTAARREGIRTSVRLRHPDLCLVVERMDSGCILGRLLVKPPRSTYQQRSADRPFRHPVGIDPAMARVMVNMAGVLPGESLLDPFCGTGTILVEAGIVGARPLGIDSSRSMVYGCMMNLKRYRVTSPGLLLADALRMPLKERFDRLVTDPPYGRSSPTSVDVHMIYRSFPETSSDVLKRGGTLCMASPSTIEISDRIEGAGFRLEAFAYQRIHGSLGRHLYLATRL